MRLTNCILFAFLLVLNSCKKETISNPNTPSLTIFNAAQDAVIGYNSTIVTDGYFSQGSKTISGGIAQWNGSIWSLLGSGVNAPPASAYCIYGNNLIAAVTDEVIEWDGTSWQQLGGVFNNPIYSLIVNNGNPVAVGMFTKVGDSLAQALSYWNGTTWQAFLGFKLNRLGNCTSVCAFNRNLIVGGVFDSVAGKTCKNIVQWNGSSWSALGNGLNYKVRLLCSYNGNLIAAGDFDSSGIVPVNHIAQWNGASWQPLDTGINCYSFSALLVYNGNLLVGVTNLGFGPINTHPCLYQWNGISWSTPFGQMSGYITDPNYSAVVFGINAMTVYNGNLIVTGGSFIFSNNPNNGIAQWNGSNWSAL